MATQDDINKVKNQLAKAQRGTPQYKQLMQQFNTLRAELGRSELTAKQAQAKAQAYQANGGKKPGAGKKPGKKPSQGYIGKVVNKDGTLKPGQADTAIQAKEAQDVNTNFNLATPGQQTDVYGNAQTVTRDPVTGQVTVNQTLGGAGASFRDAALKAAGTFGGDVSRQAAYDAQFAERTKYLDRNRSRDLEEAKQEMANRGIPYNPGEAFNPNSKNLYGRTIGGINENYQGQYADAANQATLAGNQAYATDASARDSFINSSINALGATSPRYNPYQATSTDTSGIGMDILNLSAAQFLQKYGIDKDAATKEKQIDAQTGIAHAQIAASKAGSGGGGGGFDLPS